MTSPEPENRNEHILTAQDFEFLQRPLHGFLSVAKGPVPPQPRPVWFEATAEGTVQLFTGPDTLKVRRVRDDPRASIVVAEILAEEQVRLVIHPERVSRYLY
jgi:general stress protein 26